MSNTERATVLLVEDEPAVLDSFAMMLDEQYDIVKAIDGDDAMTKIDDAIDVILLDRMMPGRSGDEVLAEVRKRNFDCQVVMVTAVDPDFDIIEMEFDDYVTKPPTESGLRKTVADVLERAEFGDQIKEYHSLLAKRSALKQAKTEAALEESEEFAELEERIATMRNRLDENNERLLDDTEFVGALRNLGDGRDQDSGQ